MQRQKGDRRPPIKPDKLACRGVELQSSRRREGATKKVPIRHKKNRLKQCECLSRKKKFPAPVDGADKIMTQDWRWIAKKTELEKLKVLPLLQHLKVYRLWTFTRRVKTSLDFWLCRR